MIRTLSRFAILLVFSLLFFSANRSVAQEQAAPAPAKPAFVTPSQRLLNAKTAYVKNGGGTSVPFDVISGAFDGWGRFIVVDSPEKADLVVEVTSPEDTKATSTTGNHISASGGTPEQSTTTSREIGSDRVKMVVQDAKSHIVLWAGSEQAKSAMKQRSYNDNLVEAAQRLMRQFHDRVEPPAAK